MYNDIKELTEFYELSEILHVPIRYVFLES